MTGKQRIRLALPRGLSARLLALTVVFVMLAEVLIYVPSISRFRKTYLEDQITKAQLAILAAEATPDNTIGKDLAMDLLFHAGAYAIVLKEPDRRMLMLKKDMPPSVDVTFDLRRSMFPGWIADALSALVQTRDRIMRVVAASPGNSDATIEVLLDETPMREAMYAFSVRILTLSIIISLITAGLVYFSLQWLMVRPIVQITNSMTRYRKNPEDESVTLKPSNRADEIGIAQRELAAMQEDLRVALHQKTRLAALGAAVAKINHDLRNTLATAVLTSDYLSGVDIPEVKKVTPRLASAVDRAVALCSQTLDFVQDVRIPVRPTVFSLKDLVLEIKAAVRRSGSESPGLDRIRTSRLGIHIKADREQMFRVFSNLALNAAQAGAQELKIESRVDGDKLLIDVTDDGPGIPEHARERLFQPFSGSAREGGTGLGLVISREIVNAHGGELSLAETSDQGTTFRIELPADRIRQIKK
jgi:signal transduction histidine kinase